MCGDPKYDLAIIIYAGVCWCHSSTAPSKVTIVYMYIYVISIDYRYVYTCENHTQQTKKKQQQQNAIRQFQSVFYGTGKTTAF